MQTHELARLRRRVQVTMVRGSAEGRCQEGLTYKGPGQAALIAQGRPRLPTPLGRSELIDHNHIAYGIPGMNEEAGNLLEKRLEGLPGVHDVTVWLGEQQIDIDYNPEVISPTALVNAIQQLGYLAKFIPRTEHWPG